MIAFNLADVELVEGHVATDPRLRGRFGFPLTGAQGTCASSLIYFEIEPGHAALRHTHSAEEVLLVLEGETSATVGDEAVTGGAGTVVFVPAHVPHGMRNTGTSTLRVVGFFAAAGMVSTYEAPIEPLDVDVLVTPDPESAMAATGLRRSAEVS